MNIRERNWTPERMLENENHKKKGKPTEQDKRINFLRTRLDSALHK